MLALESVSKKGVTVPVIFSLKEDASKIDKSKLKNSNYFLYAMLYIKQCRMLSGKFVLPFIRPWNKLENGYTGTFGRCQAFY